MMLHSQTDILLLDSLHIDILEETHVIDAKGRSRGVKIKIRCPSCEEKRWIRIENIRRNAFTGMCSKCHNKYTSGCMETHGRWKGGRRQTDNKYIQVKLHHSSPYYCMASKKSFVLEHRLVMANFLNRPLSRDEIVHHKNGERGDNRIENLELISERKYHIPSMMYAMEIQEYKDKIKTLETLLFEMMRSKNKCICNCTPKNENETE